MSTLGGTPLPEVGIGIGTVAIFSMKTGNEISTSSGKPGAGKTDSWRTTITYINLELI